MCDVSRSERDAALSLEGGIKKSGALFIVRIRQGKTPNRGHVPMTCRIRSGCGFFIPGRGGESVRNQDIRTAMQQDGLALWRVAEILGIHYNTLRNWLRKDLDAERRQQIIAAVQTAKDKRDIEEGRCKC